MRVWLFVPEPSPLLQHYAIFAILTFRWLMNTHTHTHTHSPVQLYAFAFFAIPAFRWFTNSRRNAAIGARNEARVGALRLLNRGGQWLRQVGGWVHGKAAVHFVGSNSAQTHPHIPST